MRITFLLSLIATCASAQEMQRIMIDKIGAEPVGVGAMLGEAVKGAPYSATIVTENIQTLADGNRIVQKNQGTVARDSQGRMRHEAILPVIGNLAADKMPKLVFIGDPVAGTHYSLNPADKTYRKMPVPNAAAGQHAKFAWEQKSAGATSSGSTTATATGTFDVRVEAPAHAGTAGGVHVTGDAVHITEHRVVTEKMASFKNESLGTKVIDGVVAQGTRSVRTIPAGEIGNDKSIEIVSESWFSTELKTIVYSKRSDPRSGDVIYSLTNVSRAEPDASLFAPPADFKPAAANAGNKDVIIFKAHE